MYHLHVTWSTLFVSKLENWHDICWYPPYSVPLCAIMCRSVKTMWRACYTFTLILWISFTVSSCCSTCYTGWHGVTLVGTRVAYPIPVHWRVDREFRRRSPLWCLALTRLALVSRRDKRRKSPCSVADKYVGPRGEMNTKSLLGQ